MALKGIEVEPVPEPAPDALGELVVQELTGLPVIWKPLDPKTGRSQFDAHPEGEGYSLADWQRDRDSGLYSEKELAGWRAGCFLRIRCTKAEADAHWAEVEMPAPDPLEEIKGILGSADADLEKALAELPIAKSEPTYERQPVKAYTTAALDSAVKTASLDGNVIRKEWLAEAAAVAVSAEEVAALVASLDTRQVAILTVGTGKTYSTISAAITAASAGDTIECSATTSNTYSEAVSMNKAVVVWGTVADQGLKITRSTGTTVAFSVYYNAHIFNFQIDTTASAGVAVSIGNNGSVFDRLVRSCRLTNGSGGVNTTVGASLPAGSAIYTPVLSNCLIDGFQTGISTAGLTSRRASAEFCTIVNCTTGATASSANGLTLYACILGLNGTDTTNLDSTNSAFVVTADATAVGIGAVTGFVTSDWDASYKLKTSVKTTTVARFAGVGNKRDDGGGEIRRRYATGYFYAGWHDPDPGYIPAAAEVLSTVTAYGLDNELAGSATAEAHTANQVLKSAGGNYNDDNLSVGNIRPVAFGLSQTGDLSNLVATDRAYVTLENSRNNDNGTVAADIATGKSVKIRDVTINGSGGGGSSPADPPDVTAARVSATSIRLTVTNATGVTVRSYYDTVSGGGATWTAGGTRSGNGTIDITVVEGVEYYLWVLADNGVYSIPSNVIRMNSSVGSGSTLARWLGFPKLAIQPEVLSDTRDETVISAKYWIGQGATLADMNLEPGDLLPSPLTDYRIVASRFTKERDSNAEQAQVTARKWRARVAR